MPKKYTTPEDFTTDDSFIHYCFKDNEEDVSYWENWLSDHPDQQENAKKAIRLLHLLSARVGSDKKLENWAALKENQLASDEKGTPVLLLNSWKNRLKKLWIAAAAAVLLLGTGAAFLLLHHKAKIVQPLTYQTGVGEKKHITLPDQTEVWLNAESKLSVDQDFMKADTRAVTLNGEAFFKVKKDGAHPLVVHTHTINIEVLGTEFNVKAYPQGQTTSATLIRGAIQIYLEQIPEKKIRLRPQERFTVPNQKTKQSEDLGTDSSAMPTIPKLPDFKISAVEKDPILDNELLDTAWLSGKLAFKDESFGELALQLTHKYGVQFYFENKGLQEYRFTGIFMKESLPEVLHALQLTSPSHPFKYRIEGKKVSITH